MAENNSCSILYSTKTSLAHLQCSCDVGQFNYSRISVLLCNICNKEKSKVKKTPKASHRPDLGIKLQKAVKSNPNRSWHKIPLTYHHSHFLAATLDFTSSFTIAFLGATLFFYSLAVFGLDCDFKEDYVC